MAFRNGVSISALAAASVLMSLTAPARAQNGAAQAGQGARQGEDFDPEEEILVTGQKPRGSVIGADIKPEQQFNAGDIRALGVSSINDLLTELGPQVQSASGKPPIMLLEGHRLSDPREIRTIPAEAIQRVEILPEEVGLRYGYGADQKVMNIVLRQRFRAATAEVKGEGPTRGGAKSGEGQLGFLAIRRGTRLNLSAQVTGQDRLFESERGLTGVNSPFRTLQSFNQALTINGSYHRPLTERLSGTINGELTTSRTESNIGRPFGEVTIPAGTPYNSSASITSFYPTASNIGPLDRGTSAQTGHVGFTVNRDHAKGLFTLTGTYDRTESRTLSNRPFSLDAYQAAVEAGDPLANPNAMLAPEFVVAVPTDIIRSTSDTSVLDLLYNTSIATLPAGAVSLTTHLTGTTSTYRSSTFRSLLQTDARIKRDIGSGSVSLNLPISGAGTPLADKIGQLSLNGTAQVDQLSDAGTVLGYGFGLNWTPIKGISFTANMRDQETAPTAQQLGDTATVTQNVPVFDFVNGRSSTVTTIIGGNPNLDKADTRTYRLGFVVQAKNDPQLTFTVDLTHNRTTNGISALPGITAATQLAFADRFMRDDDGLLTQVDLRPINITEQKRTQLRWGINFTKRLKTPQSEIDAMRASFARRFPNGAPGRPNDGRDGGQRGAQGGQGEQSGEQIRIPGGEGGPPPGSGNFGPDSSAQAGASGGAPAPSIGTSGIGTTAREGNGAGGGMGAGGPGGGRGPGGGFGGFGGPPGGGGPGGGGGRINFAIYHTWTIDNTAQLAPSLPVLDLLNGDTLGGGANQARHQVQLQTGYSQSGYGLRLTGNWKSATRSNGEDGTPASNLRFASLTTFNLRIFANFQQMPKLVEAIPFLARSRLSIGVDNIFDKRQDVVNGLGVTPFAYEKAFLDPIGRSVSISLRKLFL
jgi:hypothetical protein